MVKSIGKVGFEILGETGGPPVTYPYSLGYPILTRNCKFYCLRQGTSKRGEVREGSLSSEETHARAGSLWHEGLACMVTK